MPSRIGATLVALLLTLSGCSLGGDDDGAERAATRLAAALEQHDVAGVPFTTDSAATAYAALMAPLAKAPTTVGVGTVKVDGDRATAVLEWDLTLRGHHWKHATEARLTRSGETWRTRWSPALVESTLVEGESLRVSTVRAERGDILDGAGEPIVTSRPVLRVGIDKTKVPAGQVGGAARQLAALAGVDAAGFAEQVEAAGPRAFVQAIVFRRDQAPTRVMNGLSAIPGAVGLSDHLPLAPTREFAAPLLGTVGPATAEIVEESDGRVEAGDDTGLSGLQRRYDEQLSGTPGVKVSALPGEDDGSASEESSAEKAEPRVLFEVQPVAGEPLRLSLDTARQAKAEELLAGVGPASALVAIRPSTGEILAAASGPGSKGQNTASYGRYAPGSTFKVVSSLALLRAGLTPDSAVQCPPAVVVNGKRFGNYSDYPSGGLGRITLRQAVANSCNTAFIGQRAKVTGSALADAAAALGLGVDHDLGFPAYFGQVPAPAGETEAAADLIGQGRVTASPMAMAAVAASVAHGVTVVPWLVDGHTAEATGVATPLTEAEAGQLRELMHAVVTEGSGTALRSLRPPDVLAKTGTAEYGDDRPPKTHAWMLGVQGDLAVAVFVATGQSGSATAGPLLASFLRAAR